MSVLIKGMEMPKNCAVCRLEKDIFGRAVCFGYEDGRALYKDDLPPIGNEERRPSWCPLVPVPPHGRLVDADKFKEEFPHDEDWDYPVNTNSYVVETIDKSPTIIEAEEDSQ